MLFVLLEKSEDFLLDVFAVSLPGRTVVLTLTVPQHVELWRVRGSAIVRHAGRTLCSGW
jgi:hypothetical protein